MVYKLCWNCHIYIFLKGVMSDSHKTNSEMAKHVLVLSLCMVVKMGETFYCGPVGSHFLQEVLGVILESEMQLKKMKSGCEEHAVIGRSGSFYLLGDFARLYNGNRNVGGWIGLIFECFKYLFLFKSGVKQILCSMINYLSKGYFGFGLMKSQ